MHNARFLVVALTLTGMTAAAAGGGATARCKVGQKTVEVVLEAVGASDDMVLSVRAAGKPPLKLPTKDPGEPAPYAFWPAKVKGAGACDATAGVEVGGRLLFAVIDQYELASAWLFLYSPERHAIEWEGSLDGPGTPELNKIGFCDQTGSVHDVGACWGGACTRAHGVNIASTQNGPVLEVFRCAEVSEGKVTIRNDPAETWARARGLLRSLLRNRAGFEKAFGWKDGQYARYQYLTAELVDGRTCLYVHQDKEGGPADEKGWICPPVTWKK